MRLARAEVRDRRDDDSLIVHVGPGWWHAVPICLCRVVCLCSNFCRPGLCCVCCVVLSCEFEPVVDAAPSFLSPFCMCFIARSMCAFCGSDPCAACCLLLQSEEATAVGGVGEMQIKAQGSQTNKSISLFRHPSFIDAFRIVFQFFRVVSTRRQP